jgi:hypothetical protein
MGFWIACISWMIPNSSGEKKRSPVAVEGVDAAVVELLRVDSTTVMVDEGIIESAAMGMGVGAVSVGSRMLAAMQATAAAAASSVAIVGLTHVV